VCFDVWQVPGAPPLSPRAAEVMLAVCSIEAKMADPHVAAHIDSMRDRFVNECGPGGTDIPCQLKRHRSATDFIILKGKMTAAERWERAHGGPASERSGTTVEDGVVAKRRYSFPMTS